VAALAFVVPFLVLLLVTLPQGAATLVSGFAVPLDASPAQARAAFGGSDAGSLLGAAISYHRTGLILAEWKWAYSFWPPGMIWLERGMLSVHDALGVPIVVQMVIANCLALAALIGTGFTVIRRQRGLITASVFGLGVLLYSGISVWGVKSGLFYSDTFGVIGYCLALLLLALVPAATTRSRKFLVVGAGVLLAVACYFRASFEVVVLVTLAVSVAGLAVIFLIRRARRASGFTAAAPALLVPLALSSGIAEFLLAPWRLYAGLRIHPGDFRWSAVSDLVSGARWIPTRVLEAEGAGFASAGHSNWICLADPVQCERIYALEQSTSAPYSGGPDGYFTAAQLNDMATQTVISHPFSVIGERIYALYLGLFTNTGGQIGDFAVAESLIIVLLLITSLVVLIRSRTFLNPGFSLLIAATVLQFGVQLLLHMEARYFLGIELGILLIAPLILGPGGPFRRAGPELLSTRPEIRTGTQSTPE
jgi:hypothetical protein